MRVLLVGNYAPDSQHSMQRFAAMLHEGLKGTANEVRLLRPPPIIGRETRPAWRTSKWLRYIDKLLLFPRVLRREAEWADVIHICDHSNALYIPSVPSRAQVITCHDVLALQSALGDIPENPVRWPGRRLQNRILKGLRQAHRIACVSETTRTRLVKLGGFDKGRITRIYNGLAPQYAPMEQRAAELQLEHSALKPQTPFILHVGNNSWYKNRHGVLRIFASLRDQLRSPALKLVMVGKKLPRPITKLASDLGLTESVLELVEASDEDLKALYSSAMLLLFPSLAEGFGWPIIEAQACGCPVVTSDRPPMTEIGGKGAIYIDPTSPEGAAHKIINSLNSLHSVRHFGLMNAQRFSVDTMVEHYLHLYRISIAETLQPAHDATRDRPQSPP